MTYYYIPSVSVRKKVKGDVNVADCHSYNTRLNKYLTQSHIHEYNASSDEFLEYYIIFEMHVLKRSALNDVDLPYRQ